VRDPESEDWMLERNWEETLSAEMGNCAGRTTKMASAGER
jgi:hypothetical protein